MKKLIVSFLLAFTAIFSFANNGFPSNYAAADTSFPNYQQQGSPTTLTDIKGAVRPVKGVINGSYDDTTTANDVSRGNYIKFYPFAQIVTRNPANTLWIRDVTAQRWINGGGASSSTINNIYNNSIVNYVLINGDSCVVPRTGAGVAIDTICFNFAVCSVNFLNDSTFIACSCLDVNACDTGHFTPTPLYLFDQALTQITPGHVEGGGVGLQGLHKPYIVDQNGYDVIYNQANTGDFIIYDIGTFKPAGLILSDANGKGLGFRSNGDIYPGNNNINLLGYFTTNLRSGLYDGIEINPTKDTSVNFQVNSLRVDSIFKTDAFNDKIRMNVRGVAGKKDSALTIINRGAGNEVVMAEINGASSAVGCGLFKGATVFWDSLLVFTVSPAKYALCCDSVSRTSALSHITLPVADPSLGKFVAIILDANGVNYVDGTPSANPEQPQLTNCQILLTYIFIPAGATVPGTNECGVPTTTIIYDQDTPGEWDSQVGNYVTPDFVNTIDPKHFTRATSIGSFTNFKSFSYKAPASVSRTTYSSIKLFIKLKAAFDANTYLGLQLYDTISNTGSTIFLHNGQYGFNTSNTSSYQEILAPITDWTAGPSTFNKFTILMVGANGSGFYDDYIQLQAGVCQPPTTNGVTGIGVGNLSPIFSANVNITNPQVPVIGFTLSQASGGTVFGNPSATSAAPSYTTNPILGRVGSTGTLGFRGTTSGVVTVQPASIAGTWSLTLPTTDGAANEFLQTDGNGVTTWAAALTGITADNGTSTSTSTNVQLGGPVGSPSALLNNRYIATGAFTLNLSTSTGGVTPLSIISGSGIALSATATGAGSGVYAESASGFGTEVVSTTGVAGAFFVNPSSTNTVVPVMQLNRRTSSVAANNIGSSLDFIHESDDGFAYTANQIISKFTNADGPSNLVSQFIITGINNAVAGDIAYFNGNGMVGIGSSSANATRLNVVDNSVGAASMVNISSTSTAAASNLQKGLNINFSGANANASESTFGAYINNAHSGSSNANYGLWVATSNEAGGAGIVVNSTSAVAVNLQSANTTAALISVYPSSTNSVVPNTQFKRFTTGTAANGIGQSLDFIHQTSTGNQTAIANQIISTWADATNATRTSKIKLTGVLNASTVDVFTANGDGSWDIRPITATAASAITPAEGKFVFVSNTDATFVSVGIWIYQNGAWKAL